MKKALSLLLIAILCVGLFAGCAGGEKGRVYWLNFKPESDEVLQEVAKMYTEETGVEVKVLTAASGTYNQTLLAEMDKAEAPTLFVIGNQNAVKEWKDYALNLKDSAIAKELNTDAYNMYDADGNLVSIGYCYECYGIIVNPTLIEKAGYKMDDLKNFEGLKKVAEDIHKRAEELGFDAFSASDMDDSSSWRFTGHMANLEYYYESRDAGGWKECPAEIKGTYMENFKNLYDLCINNSMTPAKELATGGHDAQNQFKTGKAAFYVNGSWEYSAVAEAVPNATMIPYYAWAHRGRGNMSVWIAQDLEAARPIKPATIASLAKKDASHEPKQLYSVFDGLTPKDKDDRTIPYYHWWPKEGTTEWITLELPEGTTVQNSTLYWFDDSPWGGCRVPKSWKIYYKDAQGNWVEVPNPTKYGTEPGIGNKVEFDPVKTTALKLEVVLPEKHAAGIYEWDVK